MTTDRREEVTMGDAEFFEMALDHLCVAGFDGYWKRLSTAWMRTLGWTRDEMMMVPLIEFVHPDDREATLAARSQLVDGVPLRKLANRYRRKDGSYCWFEWRSVADPARELVYAVARDITAQKQAEAAQEQLQRQLLVADRLASVGTLAAGVAHEINNPLAYVVANLDLLAEELRTAGPERDGKLVESWKEMVRDAREGAERIRKIVHGLSTFSRTHEERRTVIDLHAILELAIELASNEIRHRARLVRELGPVPRVHADASRLGQVFLNLLVNAAQAVPEGGRERHEIRISTSTDPAGKAVVEIRDTGTGIPDEVLARMFDPFFTTKPIGTGTGLGLSICHTIVSGLGGEIAAANAPDRGAVMRIVLPAAEIAASPQVPSPAPASRHAPRRARVLIVDDERSVGATLARLLREHEVTAVTSGSEALAILRGNAAFDVILSDVMMPEMSGIELYDETTREWPELSSRFVFMTGGAFTPAAAAFLERIPNQRLDKPFDLASVREVIRRFSR